MVIFVLMVYLYVKPLAIFYIGSLELRCAVVV